MELDLPFFASLLIIGLMLASAVAALRLHPKVLANTPLKRISYTSAPMLLCFGIAGLLGARGFMLLITYVELPNMVSRHVTTESIARSTTTAQWVAWLLELVSWTLILIGFLKIKRPESPA